MPFEISGIPKLVSIGFLRRHLPEKPTGLTDNPPYPHLAKDLSIAPGLPVWMHVCHRLGRAFWTLNAVNGVIHANIDSAPNPGLKSDIFKRRDTVKIAVA